MPPLAPRRYLAEGRDRRVYARGAGLVEKVAKNEAGRLQNLCEAVVSAVTPVRFRHLARVLRVRDGGRRIHVERVVVPDIAARRLGPGFEDRLYCAVRAAAGARIPARLRLGRKIQGLLNHLVRELGVAWPDLEREDNWGMRRGPAGWEPVLLDYGLVSHPGFFRRHAKTLAAITGPVRSRRRR